MIAQGVVPKPAAVLVPIIVRGNEAFVLLTQRHAALSTHAGQIAFPGGRMDEGETPLAAALREAFEETGLHADFVEALGYLDNYLTITQFVVTPVVGLVREGFVLVPQRSEVDAIFEVPLAFLMDQNNRLKQARDWQGVTRHYYEFTYGPHRIWGATAGMIKALHDRVYGPRYS